MADCKDELKSLGEKSKKIRKEYSMLVDGYELEDGRHNMGYRELLERHKLLMEDLPIQHLLIKEYHMG